MNSIATSEFAPHEMPHDLLTALGPERAGHWLAERKPYRPTVTTHRSPLGQAAILTSSRPNTLYTKVIDVWASTDEAAEQSIAALIAKSVRDGDAGLKWEVPEGQALPSFAAGFGFAALWHPVPSAAGTEGVSGFALWHGGWPHRQISFYGQTTEFTCGAVAAMTAMSALGMKPFGDVGHQPARDLELRFWRLATNFPACEPIGLAVALHESFDELARPNIEIHLDVEGPVLLEGYDGEDRVYRELLQAESRATAIERGLPIHSDRIDVSEVVARVAAGELALLLIDEAIMHAASVPHWVLAHSVRDGAVLLHDPWVTATQGETWVDSHDLPVSVEVLDRLLAYGEPAYRGVIFVAP